MLSWSSCLKRWYCAASNKGVKMLLNLQLMQTRQDKVDEDLGRLKEEIKGEMTQFTQIRTTVYTHV